METVILMTCDSAIEANLIKGRLENHGVMSFVTNENFSNLMPHYNRILNSGAQIIINKSDYQKASEVLELNVVKKLVCPNCDSSNVKITLGKNWFHKIMIVLMSLIAVIPFNNIYSTYFCKECKCDFKK